MFLLLIRHLITCNQSRLYARSSTKFVQIIDNFNIIVENGNAIFRSSIMELMMLASLPVCSITIRVSESEVTDALDTFEQLIKINLERRNRTYH
ncbi:HPr family phosphocarrier protein [Bartonella sp. CB175]|uniref:HPr family phosphocarrier protein n=1 Tax=Bartonella sp. CB175 TaxID=3112256 RepID=UPI003FA5E877